MNRPNMAELIYLDNNSTTPIDPAVLQAMVACEEAGFLNPSSAHRAGRRARRALEDARESIATRLGADLSTTDADRLIFTSGGTESNNLALLGLTSLSAGQVVISSIEHPSVAGAAEACTRRGIDVVPLQVTPSGTVDLDHLDQLLRRPTRLVSVMAANNETGVLQPIADIAARCQAAGVLFHTDAVQMVGKMPVHFRELGAAALSFTAHKLHGPRGIGGLLLRHHVHLVPIFHGGFQQEGFRPGTESVTLAVGFETAIRQWHVEANARRRKLMLLRDRLENGLLAQLPETVVNGRQAPRSPHTSNVSFPGIDRQALLMALDMQQVACSTGSACASGSSEPSPVLVAMGLSDPVIHGSIRLSVGVQNTEREIDLAVNRIVNCVNDLRR